MMDWKLLQITESEHGYVKLWETPDSQIVGKGKSLQVTYKMEIHGTGQFGYTMDKSQEATSKFLEMTFKLDGLKKGKYYINILKLVTDEDVNNWDNFDNYYEEYMIGSYDQIAGYRVHDQEEAKEIMSNLPDNGKYIYTIREVEK